MVGACRFSIFSSSFTSERKLISKVVVAYAAIEHLYCKALVRVYAQPQPDGGVSLMDKESWHGLSRDP